MQLPTNSVNRANLRLTRAPKERSFLDVIPRDAGPRLLTFTGGAAYSDRPPGEQTFCTTEHCAAVMLAPSPRMEGVFAGDRMHRFDADIGNLVISPAQIESRSIWSSRRENITLAITPERLLELAENELDIGRLDLQPIPFGTIDKWALHLAQMLRQELRDREKANELYVDSLITLFGIHLMRTYTSGSRRSVKARGGLPHGKAKRLREYLDENLSRKLSVAELAGVCDLSPGYFIQAFTRTFGMSPHQYLIDRRLSSAERLLVQSNMSITEVAGLCGFSSQSHLTSVMRKHKHTTPAQIRRSR